MNSLKKTVSAAVLSGVMAAGAAVATASAQTAPQKGNGGVTITENKEPEFTAEEKATISLVAEFVKCTQTEKGPFDDAKTAAAREKAEAFINERLDQLKAQGVDTSQIPTDEIERATTQVTQQILVGEACVEKTKFDEAAAEAKLNEMAQKYGPQRVMKAIQEAVARPPAP